MKTWGKFWLILIIFFSVFAIWLFWEIEDGKKQIIDIFKEIKTTKFEKSEWQKIAKKSEELPFFYPFYEIKNSLENVPKILEKAEIIEKEIKTKNPNLTKIIDDVFVINEKIGKILKTYKKLEKFIPKEIYSEKIDPHQSKIQTIKTWQKNLANLQITFGNLQKNNSRLLILLQNQNEPRPTGGFMGSFITIDFEKDGNLDWIFRDIYEIDRKIPVKNQIPAPEFFHNLSPTISLRDANFWANFPTSAEKIRDFFQIAKEKKPDIILAINMNLITDILEIIGEVELKKWGVILNKNNFDLVLQTLVEGKVSGRYDVKNPVLEFANQLIKSVNLQDLDWKKIQNFIDGKSFIIEKNILANSDKKELQKLFKNWKIDGNISQKNEADNFLYFDFVSVGANKSEKFMWTKIEHNSEISQNGLVENSLKIKRKHNVRNGEIENLLQTKTWYENLRGILDEDILWKLGDGQNRTVLRVFIPPEAEIYDTENISGEIKSYVKNDFKIIEIPMFVVPQESVIAYIKYRTKIDRGDKNWRPYFLQLVGTPGRKQSTILATISTKNDGKFSAKTMNIGKPVNLIDQDWRSVVKF